MSHHFVGPSHLRTGPGHARPRDLIEAAVTALPHVVVVSRGGRSALPDDEHELLERHATVEHVRRDAAMSHDDAADVLADADVVAATPLVTPTWTTELLDALPRLRGLAVYATGLDFLDLDLLAARDVEVAHLPAYSSIAVAEHTLGLILTMSSRIHLANDRSRGLAPQDVSLRGVELAGRTLGVIGLGRIGARVARLGGGVGMQVIGHDPGVRHAVGVDQVPFEELLRRSDVVSLNVPLDPDAPPLLGRDELALLRPGAFLVNTARAALVDTDAVVAAIRDGSLRGYAVDDEVLDRDAHADLLAEGRVVQTGHSAWWADEVLRRGGQAWLQAMTGLVVGDAAVRPTAAADGMRRPG